MIPLCSSHAFILLKPIFTHTSGCNPPKCLFRPPGLPCVGWIRTRASSSLHDPRPKNWLPGFSPDSYGPLLLISKPPSCPLATHRSHGSFQCELGIERQIPLLLSMLIGGPKYRSRSRPPTPVTAVCLCSSAHAPDLQHLHSPCGCDTS